MNIESASVFALVMIYFLITFLRVHINYCQVFYKSTTMTPAALIIPS